MTMPSPRRLVLALAAVLPAIAAAQTPPIKPGLWEVRSESSGPGGKPASQPADRLQSLPPSVRAQVEASMKQKGIAMGPGGANKICMTKESMDPARWGASAKCKTDYGARSGSSWKWHSVCAQPEMTIDGEAVFASTERYSVNTSMTMTANGRTQTSQRTIQGRWLGADCGDLKPLDLQR